VKAIPDADYAHRKNTDGTCDSICLYCFSTVASAQSQAELGALEEHHMCDAKTAFRKRQKDDTKH
jgi:hypothetical protein